MTPDSGIIKPENRKEWMRALKAWPNFLKHADNDPAETIVFNSAVNEHILFESIIIFSNIYREKRPIFQCFHMWMIINESVWFKPEYIERIRKTVPIEQFKKLDKGEFFNEMLPIFTSGIIHTTN